MLLGLKQRVATGDTSQDHVGAVAEGHLAIIEQQHHRDRRSRLDDLLEARAQRPAWISKAVGPGACLDRGQVPVEEPGSPDDRDDVLDSRHGVASRPN